jgi:ABC-type multidrug transport system ATPase subunit
MSETILKVKNLTKKDNITGEIKLNHIDFEIKKGALVSFLGVEGAGISTLMKILEGREEGDRGFVETNTNKISLISSNSSLDIELTVEQNIRVFVCLHNKYKFVPFYFLMSEKYKNNLEKIICTIGLEQSILKQKTLTLTKIQTIKIEIIKTVLLKPEILILDNFLVGLDIVEYDEVFNCLKKINKSEKITTISTTKDINIAMKYDQIYILNRGRVIFHGNKKMLTKKLDSQYLLLETEKHAQLITEIGKMECKIFFEDNNSIKVNVKNIEEARIILNKIQSPLSKFAFKKLNIKQSFFDYIKIENDLQLINRV